MIKKNQKHYSIDNNSNTKYVKGQFITAGVIQKIVKWEQKGKILDNELQINENDISIFQ